MTFQNPAARDTQKWPIEFKRFCLVHSNRFCYAQAPTSVEQGRNLDSHVLLSRSWQSQLKYDLCTLFHWLLCNFLIWQHPHWTDVELEDQGDDIARPRSWKHEEIRFRKLQTELTSLYLQSQAPLAFLKFRVLELQTQLGQRLSLMLRGRKRASCFQQFVRLMRQSTGSLEQLSGI